MFLRTDTFQNAAHGQLPSKQQSGGCCCPSCPRTSVRSDAPADSCPATEYSVHGRNMMPQARFDMHVRSHVPDHTHLQGYSALMTARQSCGCRCPSCARCALTASSQTHSAQLLALAAAAWPRFHLSWPHAEMSTRHLHNRFVCSGLKLLVRPSL